MGRIPKKPITMLATMGGQPQVVTFALDALLAEGYEVQRLEVIHLGFREPRHKQALSILKQELAQEPYKKIVYHPRVVRLGAAVIEDIRDGVEADKAWHFISHLVGELKGDFEPLHICVSGGRRLLGLLMMSAAMLHFGSQDRLWHMYTPEELQEEARGGRVLHVPAGVDFRLIEIPLLPLGRYFPHVKNEVRPDGPPLAGPKRAMEQAEQAKVEQSWEQFSVRQRQIVQLVAQGLTPDKVIVQLGISENTRQSHMTEIYKVCRAVWGLPAGQRLDLRFVADKFGAWRGSG